MPLDDATEIRSQERTAAVGETLAGQAGIGGTDTGRGRTRDAHIGVADAGGNGTGKAVDTDQPAGGLGENGSPAASDGWADIPIGATFSVWERPRRGAFGGSAAEETDRGGDPRVGAYGLQLRSHSAAASDGERADAARVGGAAGAWVDVPTVQFSPLDAPDQDRVRGAHGAVPGGSPGAARSRSDRHHVPFQEESSRRLEDSTEPSIDQPQRPSADLDAVVADSGTGGPRSAVAAERSTGAAVVADSGTGEPRSAVAAERSTGAAVLRLVGEILITLGVVLLLFCVYQLFYTNIESNRAQAKIKNGLQQDWKQPQHVPDADPVPDDFSGIGQGDAFAIMYIPRLGLNWQKPVLEGVTLDELARGLGHYPDSAMPGEVGNFAVAGHRATHGQPFRELDKVQQGDVVIVETENNWYRYVIDKHEIVDPTDVGVVLPVPNQPGAKPKEKLITLTTCNPRWASTQRLIYWGHLESVTSKAAGIPAELQN